MLEATSLAIKGDFKEVMILKFAREGTPSVNRTYKGRLSLQTLSVAASRATSPEGRGFKVRLSNNPDSKVFCLLFYKKNKAGYSATYKQKNQP